MTSEAILSGRQIAADDLHGISAFDAGQRLLHIVLNVLREIEINSGQLVGKFVLQLVDQHVLGIADAPLLIGL